MENNQLIEKVDKLLHQAQDNSHQSKREIDASEKRHDEIVSGFERQARELRSQISMKNKDISSYREESADLESRLQTKSNELRTVKT